MNYINIPKETIIIFDIVNKRYFDMCQRYRTVPLFCDSEEDLGKSRIPKLPPIQTNSISGTASGASLSIHNLMR